MVRAWKTTGRRQRPEPLRLTAALREGSRPQGLPPLVLGPHQLRSKVRIGRGRLAFATGGSTLYARVAVNLTTTGSVMVSSALLTDHYELTMLDAALRDGT